jgi:hypothetical protein
MLSCLHAQSAETMVAVRWDLLPEDIAAVSCHPAAAAAAAAARPLPVGGRAGPTLVLAPGTLCMAHWLSRRCRDLIRRLPACLPARCYL